MKALVTRTVLYVAILIIAMPAIPLFAQQTTDQQQEKKTAEEEKKPKVTEEMVVTARKQEETIQTIPISVAAPTESQLRDRGAENLEDVSANVAGFTVQNAGPGQSQVGMRGISAGRIIRDQPGVKEQVGVYLDESVISLSLFTPDVDLFDLSRVEVLRGPQGTLFGSGSLAGTLRYITNQPKIGVTESTAELTASSIDQGGVGGSAKYAGNFPIGDTAAGRFVAYYTRYGGYIDAVQPNLGIKKDYNDGHRAGGRAAFTFQPNDRLRITPRLLYQDVDLKGWNRIDVYNILANPFTTTRPKVTFGERQTFTQTGEPFTDKFTLGDVNLEYKLGSTTLSSVTSYTNRDILVVRDATALTASITGGSIALPPNAYTIDAPLNDKTTAHGITEEVRLASGTPSKFNWVTGVYYNNSKRNYAQNLPVIGFTSVSGIPTAGTKIAKTDELFKSDLHYDFKQFAVFGEGTLNFTDKIDLTAGLRYYDFKENRTQVFDGIFSDPLDSRGKTDATGFAPRVIFTYKLSPNTRVNAQVSKGFRLGGINDPLNLPLCAPQDIVAFGGRPTWKDETLYNYEIGSKSTIMNGRGSFNASAYYDDIKNLQAPVTAGQCSSRIVLNVPKARTTGVEAEFELAPTDMFDFSVSGNFNSSELRSTIRSPDANNVPQIVAGLKSGNRLASVPETQVAASATYRWQLRQGTLTYLTGVYQHIGDRYTQLSDQAAGFGVVNLNAFKGKIGGPYTQQTFTFDPKLPAYDVLNLRVGLLRGRFDTALFVNNVTDERALLALDIERGSLARVSFLTNQPRTFGLSTRVNF